MENDRKILDEIIKKIDIPVYEVSYDEYFKILEEKDEIIPSERTYYCGKKNKKRIAGVYHASHGHKKGAFIFLYRDTKVFRKIFAILHEYSHYLCDKENCSCIISSDMLKVEYHATEYVLKECFEKKYLLTLYTHMKNILSKYPQESHDFMRIHQAIKITKLWANCIKLLEENNYDISFKKRASLYFPKL